MNLIKKTLFVVLVAACSRGATFTPSPAAQSAWLLPGALPDEPPSGFVGLIGEYDTPAGMRLVLEDSGRLWIADTVRHTAPLTPRAADEFTGDASTLLGVPSATRISFTRDASG